MSKSLQNLETDRIRALFKPRSVAILGASDDPDKIGGRPIRYLKQAGFTGQIYPVNLRRKTVQNLPAYPTIGAIPEAVDLALIALPANMVVDAVQNCADKGIGSVILFSAGFAEIGEQGRHMQSQITAIAQQSGMRILGPNCLGAINLRQGMIGTFTAGLEGGLAKPGRIGFVSQSGALGSHCFAAFRERGLGFSYWVTTGNECDIEFADCLAYLAKDQDTDVVAAYIEGCRDGHKLRAALELARQNRKPVVVLKVGESEIGAQAASSHTASLAGADDVYNAVFKEYGVIRASSIYEFMELTYACSTRMFPEGKRIGLITVSGGVGVLMADRAASLGLNVAPMPEKVQRRMKARWEPAAVRNPVDTTAQVTSDRELLREFLELMLEEGQYDAIVIFLAHTGLVKTTSDNLRSYLWPLRQRYPDRLIMTSMLYKPEVRADYESDGFPVFEDPSMAVQAASVLMRFGRQFKRSKLSETLVRREHSSLVPSHPINEHQAKELLARAGVPVVDERLVSSAEEAVSVAEIFGTPVVLKIASRDIVHKTEVGGVMLNLTGPDAVAQGYERIIREVAQKRPRACIDGVIVSRMVEDGVECLVGVHRDQTFGPVVTFGLGGVFVEALRDVTLRVAPFGVEEAKGMIHEIKGYAVLKGARGRPRADLESLAQALSNVAQFAWENRNRIESLDINPFIVLPNGQGSLAVDALIVPHVVHQQEPAHATDAP